MDFAVGDRVQVYIPNRDDPDQRYHGEVGEVVDVFEDDLGDEFDSPSRGYLYTVEFHDADLKESDFRYSDLQVPDDF